MAHAEKRGRTWRARWVGPHGTRESKPGFTTKRTAEDYGRDQEAAIRNNTYIDPRAGQITLTDWVNTWFPAQNLERSTLANYRTAIEVHILPAFGERPLGWLTPEEIAVWENSLVSQGVLSRRSARDVRGVLTTLLHDAIPRYIQTNPAARKRGKGRKGERRIERVEQGEKAWATPLQALLVAERCAALSGHDTDFVMVVTIAYTGMRWSETIGLRPGYVHGDTIDVHWKLYEQGRFYFGRPKDGSMRTIDVPPFLQELLGDFLRDNPSRKCTCRNANPPWCTGDKFVFLGPRSGHFRRSSYGERYFRPAADGWYPEREEGRDQRPAMPVLVDTASPYPGGPLAPWQPAEPDRPFVPRTGRGVPRLVNDDGNGRCPICRRAFVLRRDGGLVSHKADGARCDGSGRQPAEDLRLASWLPILSGLTPHGLRHGHETWMDEAGVREVLQNQRMGHEIGGVRGIYLHVSQPMRETLTAALEERWEESLRERARISRHSLVPTLDALLATYRGSNGQDHPHFAPEIGHRT